MRAAWLTGASGFVGGRLARHLDDAGWRVVRARVRPGDAPMPVPAAADVVFHLAGLAGGRRSRAAFLAANCELPVRLYEAAARRDCRGFVFVSSAKVLGASLVSPASEDAPRQAAGAYAESKARAEERLLAAHARHGLPLAIVRPPLVYGPGVRGHFRLLLWCVARGVPLPLADADGLRSLVSVANLAAALEVVGAALGNAQQRDARIWHVADGEDVSTATLCGDLAGHLDRDAALWRLPAPVRAGAERVVGSGPFASAFAPFRLDDGALRQEHRWSPPQSRDQALRETVRAFTTPPAVTARRE